MTTAPGPCTHSFPDPYPQPIDQPGNCRDCDISYQEAKDAAMSTAADELRAAATLVRSVAEANKAISENRPLPPEMQGRTRADVTRADMHPAVGRALAELLETAADYVADDSPTHPTHVVRALAVARQINAGSKP